MASTELSVSRLCILSLVILAVDNAEFVYDLDDHRRGMPEENELLHSGDTFVYTMLLRAKPFVTKHLANIGNGLLIIEVKELERLVLDPLPVIVKI